MHFFLAARKKIQIHAYPDGGEACFFIYIVDFLWSILDCGFRSSHIIVQGICDFFLQLSPNMAVMPCKISNHEKTSLFSPVHFFNAFFAQKNRFLISANNHIFRRMKITEAFLGGSCPARNFWERNLACRIFSTRSRISSGSWAIQSDQHSHIVSRINCLTVSPLL